MIPCNHSNVTKCILSCTFSPHRYEIDNLKIRVGKIINFHKCLQDFHEQIWIQSTVIVAIFIFQTLTCWQFVKRTWMSLEKKEIYLFMYCENHRNVSRRENVFAHGMKSHMTTLFFFMPLAVQGCWFFFAKVNRLVSRRLSKIKTLYKQKASLASIMQEKPLLILLLYREKEAYFTVATCWLDTNAPDGNFTEGKRWEEPSSMVLQTLKDENIENQDTTYAQQRNILIYTVNGHEAAGVFLVD